MIVRLLTPADATIYRAFRLRGLRDNPEAFTSSFEEESVRPLSVTESRLAATGDTRVWGAVVGERIAGSVGMTSESRSKSRHKATIVAMYVTPEFAGRGTGAQLLATAIERARADGIEQLVLTVTASNAAARRLYARAGFVTFGVEPRALKIGDVYHAKEHMLLQIVAS